MRILGPPCFPAQNKYVAAGRFAPSPTGELHLGNLRTALVAWLCARSTGSRFVLRFEDLDRVTSRPEFVVSQTEDLRALGLDWDDEPLVQSTRFDAHHEAIDRLIANGHTYECFCTRREIAEATQAPNGPSTVGPYPGRCRLLTEYQRADYRAAGRVPAVRLRSPCATASVFDRLQGPSIFPVDDVVLRRNDGVPAYNLAVVVDDAFQRVEEVVRADDLLPSAAPQQIIARLLDLPPILYVHVPLAVNAAGQRLAKRDGAVTIRQLAAQGISGAQALAMLARSLDLCAPRETPTLDQLLQRVSVDALPRQPWVAVP